MFPFGTGLCPFVLLFSICWLNTTHAETISIASWNIRFFSTGSREDSELELIADRLQQFDLISIQELRDEEVVERTLAILANRGDIYKAVVSRPVGQSVKERYGFFYRSDRIMSLDQGRLWEDTDDQFLREPFYSSFRAGQFDFTLVTVHLIYGKRVAQRRAEAMQLDDVYRAIQEFDASEQDVIVLGDFNLPPDDPGLEELRSFLIPVLSDSIRTSIHDGSALDNLWWDTTHVSEWTGESGLDRFDEEVFEGDDKAASLAVSDHRPVWATFRTDGTDDDGTSGNEK